jgi:hypothetical protein
VTEKLFWIACVCCTDLGDEESVVKVVNTPALERVRHDFGLELRNLLLREVVNNRNAVGGVDRGSENQEAARDERNKLKIRVEAG